MMKTKISFLILILIIFVFISGCSSTDVSDSVRGSTDVSGTTTVKKTIVPEDFDSDGVGMLKCSTEAYAGEGIDVNLKYAVKYNNGNILELISVQNVVSESQDSLDLYEDAYKKIALNYNGLNYYVTDIVRDSNSVTYTITINYDEINVKKLLEIEGEEDNIIKNGKAKLSLWLDLASKMGTLCEEA